MSDQGSSKIKNTEELMQKILGFQDQLRSASEVLASMPVTDKNGQATGEQQQNAMLDPKAFATEPPK